MKPFFAESACGFGGYFKSCEDKVACEGLVSVGFGEEVVGKRSLVVVVIVLLLGGGNEQTFFAGVNILIGWLGSPAGMHQGATIYVIAVEIALSEMFIKQYESFKCVGSFLDQQ